MWKSLRAGVFAAPRSSVILASGRRPAYCRRKDKEVIMKITAPATALLILIAAGAAVKADPVTLSTYLRDPSWTERFDTMFGNSAKPDWVQGATESEAVAVTLNGQPYEVLLACKKHDCGNHQLAVLFDKDAMYGLHFETTDNSPEEELIWLNIGGGPESIDGKTILYAAITGSLFNHPELFTFPAEE
ncbi:C-lysozyme inhibitor [Sinirhodobacter populi]|uniref:C-lysozyme inhibitor n=2 Tax=Paenirhodobacter populi TaxID=2306993 RepID=A0A443IYT0_9RHOB|nr:C-lysozyme inhibitor [Sinirhodobacter populi]